MTPGQYTFRKATVADLPMLLKWQGRPHVRKWWDSAEPADVEAFEDKRVSRWIVGSAGKPFAYETSKE